MRDDIKSLAEAVAGWLRLYDVRTVERRLRKEYEIPQRQAKKIIAAAKQKI